MVRSVALLIGLMLAMPRLWAADRDYYRLSELRSPADCVGSVREWAQQWYVGDLSLDPSLSRLEWPGQLLYCFTSPDGEAAVAVSPVWEHCYSWATGPLASPGALRDQGIAPRSSRLEPTLGMVEALASSRQKLSDRTWCIELCKPNEVYLREMIAGVALTESSCGGVRSPTANELLSW